MKHQGDIFGTNLLTALYGFQIKTCSCYYHASSRIPLYQDTLEKQEGSYENFICSCQLKTNASSGDK
jgi:hypothetical protein